MSRENVEVVRRAYALWNSGDWERFLELFHPELVFTASGTFPGFDPVYRGREGMVRFSDTMLEVWESFEIEPTQILDRGDYVIADLRFRATGRASGVEVTVGFHHVCHFRDGLLDRLVSHPDRAEALQAAGLRE
jgi:ketosteroid isomerase-like protein